MADSTNYRYKPSFLDRISDPDRTQFNTAVDGQSDQSGGKFQPSRDFDQTYFKKLLRRDIEDLLNTHRPPVDYFDVLEEAGKSIMNFGLQDVTQFPSKSEAEKQQIYRHIQEVIEDFEPRLENVRVTARDPEEIAKTEKDNLNHGSLYLRIEAKLRGDSEDIVFESMLKQGHHTLH